MKKKIYIVFIIFILYTYLGAMDTQMPMGTRSAGLMNAYSALADDAEAIILNPAGLGSIDEIRFYASSYKWHGLPVNHTLLSGISPLPQGFGTIGVMWRGLDNSKAIGFTDKEDWVACAYAQRISKFQFGFNFKYQWFQSGETVRLTEKKVNADAGFIYSLKRRVKIGLVVHNLYNKHISGDDALLSESSYKLGLTFSLFRTLALSIEGEITEDEMLARGGAEWSLGQYITIRGGLNDLFQIGLGGSIQLDSLQFGYAYHTAVEHFAPTHFVSLSYKIKLFSTQYQTEEIIILPREKKKKIIQDQMIDELNEYKLNVNKQDNNIIITFNKQYINEDKEELLTILEDKLDDIGMVLINYENTYTTITVFSREEDKNDIIFKQSEMIYNYLWQNEYMDKNQGAYKVNILSQDQAMMDDTKEKGETKIKIIISLTQQ